MPETRPRRKSPSEKQPKKTDASSDSQPPDERSQDVSSTSPTPMTTAAVPRPGQNNLWMGLGLAVLVGGTIFYARSGEQSTGTAGDPIEIHPRVPTDDPEDGVTVPPEDRAERLGVRVLATHPHDPTAFTQGLVWHEGTLYEGTGLYGRSTIRRVDLATGEVQASESLPRSLFGEGIALVGDRFFQITWQEGIALVRRREDFGVEREIEYDGEGWGLCYDGSRIVMSDGSAELFFRNAETFAVEGRVTVRLDGEELDQLNELECVDGLVYANVWQSDHIARIDPATGRVTGWIDTSLHEGSPEGARMLEPADAEHADVLNGIAWIPERQRFLIGGKEWPHFFEVEFVARED